MNRGIVDGFSITGGLTTLNGGGIYNDSFGTVQNCEIYGNTAVQLGGGIYNKVLATVRNCDIHDNIISGQTFSAQYSATGNGIYNDGYLSNSRIYKNSIAEEGTNSPEYYYAVSAQQYSTVSNCLIYNNNCSGIFNWGTISNTTVFGNNGIGIHYVFGGKVYNCISWKNEDLSIYYSATGLGLVYRGILSNCCYNTPSTSYWPGDHSVHSNPQFVKVEGDPSTWDFHLKGDSPCIDAALDEECPETDIDGVKRPQGTSCDIGAYEYNTFSSVFSADVESGLAPLTVSFIDRSYGDPASWQWDFTNDGIIDSTEEKPLFTYTESGYYSVRLVVTNEENESRESTRENFISVAPDGTDQYGAESAGSTIPAVLDANKSYEFTVSFKNTGYQTWKKGREIKLGAVNDADPLSSILRYHLEEDIRYGETAVFTIQLQTSDIGSYITSWQMVNEGDQWFGNTFEETIQVENETTIQTPVWNLY